jgi:hypothetical protein
MDFENEKTPLDMMRITIPNELEGLFREPPLLEGENANLYWGLLAAMIKDCKPQSFSDWIHVHDTVSNLLEEQRYKRVSTDLMRGEKFTALTYFLKQNDLNPALASEYFSEDPEERQEAVLLLTRYGITPALLQAKAAQANGAAIQMLENMTKRREKNRRKDRREDKQRRQADKDSQKP